MARLRSKLAKWVDGRARRERLLYLRGKREGRTVSLRRVGGIELPDAGRSSIETTSGNISAYLQSLGSVSPVIDFEILRCLKNLWIFNPDFSQYVANIVNLGNTGHQLTIDTQNSTRAEAALARLNEAASRIYVNGAGVDGLVNAYLAQIAWSGALSSEDVVNFTGKRVEKVVLVPVEQIRFVYEDGDYLPHQQGTFIGAQNKTNRFGLIPLNRATYRYYALQTVENSPYAKPPATAAVEAITGMQTDTMDNIKFIARKLGILGLVSVNVTPPPRKPSEAEAEYQSRAKKYLSSVREALESNFNKGLMVTYKDQKVEHANVASDARGSYDIVRVIEEQVMSAFAMQPAFFGRTDSTTETYADVVYNLLLAQVSNLQRLVKRSIERTYRLDLRLGAVDVDGVSVAFGKAHARDPLQEAQAQQVIVQTTLEKARAGIISPDEAAQELGYESAFDPEMLDSPDVAASLQGVRLTGAESVTRFAATFKFDRASQKYRFVNPRIEISSDDSIADNVYQLSKKKKELAA